MLVAAQSRTVPLSPTVGRLMAWPVGFAPLMLGSLALSPVGGLCDNLARIHLEAYAANRALLPRSLGAAVRAADVPRPGLGSGPVPR